MDKIVANHFMNIMIRYLYFFFFLFFIHAENQNEAASHARFLVENQIKGSFSTLSISNDFALASLEDCSQSFSRDGNLIFLLADISKVAENLKKNPTGSFLLSADNCSSYDYDHLPYDPLACARVSFSGEFKMLQLPLDNKNKNYLNFIEKHPAAYYWINYSPHNFHLWTLDIKEIYYVGGYGNLHYIGTIDVDLYQQSQPTPPSLKIIDH